MARRAADSNGSVEIGDPTAWRIHKSGETLPILHMRSISVATDRFFMCSSS